MAIVPTYVSSANLEAVGYKAGDLFVRFVSGPVYRYEKVPYPLVQKLIDAESVGKFFNEHIKPVFTCTREKSDPFADKA